MARKRLYQFHRIEDESAALQKVSESDQEQNEAS